MAQIDNIININSSYSITASEVGLESVSMRIWIYTGTQGGSEVEGIFLDASNDRVRNATYILDATAVSNGSNKEVSFEIASLIKDFIESELNGQYNSDNTVWVDIQRWNKVSGVNILKASEHYLAVDGYEYTRNDGANDVDKIFRISNRNILKLSGQAARIPVLSKNMISFAFEKDGEIVNSGTATDFPDTDLSNEQISYISNSTSNLDSFESRVLSDGDSKFEYSRCLAQFELEFDVFDADTLFINYDFNADPLVVSNPVDVITLTNIEECRYDSKKLTFINKFGAFQDVWFFKNSKRALDVKSDTWNRRNLTTGGGAFRPTTVKNTTSVNEKITLNSGFYPEDNNVVFEELMQSNSVWIWEGLNTYPVIIKDSTFNFKDSNTDKLINYTLNIEYAFNKMQSL